MARKFKSTPDYPVVETQWGKLRGFELDGIFNFYGIQYAKAKRFQMPEDLDPWEGVKNATNYGPICPTMGNPIPSVEIMIPHRFWPENENCQFLNIWTKSLDKDAKKPVIVWYHGGGYADGSSLEQVAYEGDALCEYGDVVVVTVNHRLNILGYFDLSSFGEKYWNSGNAGNADIVASLKWIHNNIAAFGGDPENVTIFGQSGGGGKVCDMLQTPAAEGLFHKGILMSGGAGSMRAREPEDHKAFAEAMLKSLGLSSIEELETIPYDLLTKAYVHVCNVLQKALMWHPIPNDWYLGHPVNVGFSDYAKKVPTIVTTVECEFTAFGPMDKVASPDEFYQGHGAEALEAFHKAYPGKPDWMVSWISDRTSITRFMEARDASNPETPGYTSVFALEFELDNGRPAWHCSDIPYVFHNTFRCPYTNIEGVSDKLEEEIAGALVAFARTGDPNHDGMPEWKPYTKDCPATMVFGRASECKVDFDKELNDIMQKYTPPFTFTARIPKEDDNAGREWQY